MTDERERVLVGACDAPSNGRGNVTASSVYIYNNAAGGRCSLCQFIVNAAAAVRWWLRTVDSLDGLLW